MPYTLNDSYFDIIDTEGKAYFLGLMFADGCVQPNGSSWRIRIGLHIKDEDIVIKFRDTLEYSGPLRKIPSRTTLDFSSRHLGASLVSHGCVPRKSLVLTYPNKVPEKLFWHFTRGYFDGDGALSIFQRGVRWTLVGTKMFLDAVAARLKTNGIHASVLRPANSVWMLSVSGNRQVKRLLDKLYYNSTFYMLRKWNKAREFDNLLKDIRPIRVVRKPFDKSAVVKAYVDGVPILEIEKTFDITNRTVYKYLKQFNIPLREKRKY